MSFFSKTPCHLCEKMYPDFFQKEFENNFYCLFDFYKIKKSTLLPFLSVYSTSSKFDNALWIYELKHKLLKEGVPLIIKTYYDEHGEDLKSIFELVLLDKEDATKIRPEFLSSGPA